MDKIKVSTKLNIIVWNACILMLFWFKKTGRLDLNQYFDRAGLNNIPLQFTNCKLHFVNQTQFHHVNYQSFSYHWLFWP
jgi:hypothetical protein